MPISFFGAATLTCDELVCFVGDTLFIRFCCDASLLSCLPSICVTLILEDDCEAAASVEVSVGRYIGMMFSSPGQCMRIHLNGICRLGLLGCPCLDRLVLPGYGGVHATDCEVMVLVLATSAGPCGCAVLLD